MKCVRNHEGTCKGRTTHEHALIFAGKQIEEEWAVIDLCEYHHDVGLYQDAGNLEKEKNIWIALNRATEDQLKKYSNVRDLVQLRTMLNKRYGVH